MTILDRLAASLRGLDERWNGRRIAKAFYLRAADFEEFLATDPPTVETVWGNNPPKERVEPAFEGVPVRPSKGDANRLYDHTSSGHTVPIDPANPPPPREVRADIPADKVFAALDAISRIRALSESESRALEAAMKGKVVLSTREAVRLGIKRAAGA